MMASTAWKTPNVSKVFWTMPFEHFFTTNSFLRQRHGQTRELLSWSKKNSWDLCPKSLLHGFQSKSFSRNKRWSWHRLDTKISAYVFQMRQWKTLKTVWLECHWFSVRFLPFVAIKKNPVPIKLLEFPHICHPLNHYIIGRSLRPVCRHSHGFWAGRYLGM